MLLSLSIRFTGVPPLYRTPPGKSIIHLWGGWRRYHEWLYYDGEGYLQHDYDRHRKNEFWEEAVEVCESLVSTAGDHEVVTRAVPRSHCTRER